MAGKILLGLVLLAGAGYLWLRLSRAGMIIHPMATNDDSAIGTLRSLATSQDQFMRQGLVDQDGDGHGEYGWFAELSGSRETRGTPGKPGSRQDGAPFVALVLGRLDASGRALKSGYHFWMYLPTKPGPARPEPPDSPGALAPADADAQEVRWACYAWPVERGNTGARAFFVNQEGRVHATRMETTRYSGDSGPRPEAAFEAGAPGAPNLDAPIGAPPRRAGDGNAWVRVRE